MFYTIGKQGVCRKNFEDIGAGQDFAGYLPMEELPKYEKVLEISGEAVEACMFEQAYFHIGLDIYDRFSFGIINVINIHNVNKENSRLAFYVKKNMFLIVEMRDTEGKLKEKFRTIIEKEGKAVTLEKVVFHLFESFLEDGNSVLGEMEQKIIALERNVVEGNINKNLNKRIFELKRKLTIQKNYYQQLSSIGAGFLENENDIFRQQESRYFKVFTDKAERLYSSTQGLCESLVHVREALDAAMDYSLNSIMKVFTVVTTIFLPLTLIAGWYGMNFVNMPELGWKYGYPVVIAASLLVVAGCLLFFKWKKLL